ncbi:MAG: zinc ribbon domain-containing protein [Bacteroidales bacterium]|nr:zinc ribbon domain-containing protein [Bacteroidales bacterium]
MGTFNTKKELMGNPSLIPVIAENIEADFANDGYEVKSEALVSGGYDISLTKGGMFKAVLGMKTALKVTLLPNGSTISFEAGIGIFGQQVIPTLIMLFVTWPVIITQIWGLVKQADLDDRALKIAENTIAQYGNAAHAYPGRMDSRKFCTSCGSPMEETVKFCSNCGKKL